MGEIAEMIVEGTLCQYCQAYMGGSVGYPRTCRSCSAQELKPAINKEAYPVCNRKVKGLADHMRDLHPNHGVKMGDDVTALRASLATVQNRLFDVLLGDDGQASKEARKYLERERADLYALLEQHAKCDGNHGGQRCADPECWNDEPVALILEELRRAVSKFPTWPTDPLHAIAVLGEEFGELTKATLQTTYEPHKSNRDDVRTEAIQTAAMALRFVISLDRYEYAHCTQHEQSERAA